jgi:hypothetical protein
MAEVEDIIDAAIDDNALAIQNIVGDLMKERVAEILANRKIEVSQRLFNSEE